MTLNDLRDEIYQDAVQHGLWDERDGQYDAAMKVKGEATELVTEAMKLLFAVHGEDIPDRGTLEEAYRYELADVIIMALSAAGQLGIDIDHYVRSKMEINRKRPYKHGKEAV